MSVILDIDQDTQRTLEQAFGQSLPQAAIEALAIEGYRSRRFGTLAQAPPPESH